MFTHRRSHAQLVRAGSLIAATALGAGLAVIGPVAVNAVEVPTWYAEGRFLSGSLLGIDLDQVALLAAARATVVDPECTVNCGGGTDPDPNCVVDCGSGSTTPAGSSDGSKFGGPAMTGIAIGALIMLILSLLAAGAILITAGYRQNHPRMLENA